MNDVPFGTCQQLWIRLPRLCRFNQMHQVIRGFETFLVHESTRCKDIQDHRMSPCHDHSLLTPSSSNQYSIEFFYQVLRSLRSHKAQLLLFEAVRSRSSTAALPCTPAWVTWPGWSTSRLGLDGEVQAIQLHSVINFSYHFHQE